jgi:predicted NAD/FAD-binding protein
VRIAVIGSGIAGLGSAWLLDRSHEVTLYEKNDYLGGHTHTHDIELHGRHFAVDTGFIVHNPRHYPLLTALFAELGVRSRATTMSFSVRNQHSGLEYSASSLATLFCQSRNLVSPRFYGMLADIVRFYRRAPALLAGTGSGPTLGEFLTAERYGAAFRNDHLVPMASALWSSPPHEVLRMPLRFLLRFMANHDMLRLSNRPPWQVVAGGSVSYVRAMAARWMVRVRLDCPVERIERDRRGVTVISAAGRDRFDQVVLACHSDEALALLEGGTDAERRILGALPYHRNTVVLHTDDSFMPSRRRAWAAWNAVVSGSLQQPATVTYCMNLLQGIEAPCPLLVTLNPGRPIAADHVLRQLRYAHPLYTPAAVTAQAQGGTIQGRQRTWFAGAYWGFGFHEDGLRSAVKVAEELGVRWRPATAPATGLAQVAA